ncbi:COX15/CtaA family protein [Nocardioides dongkuii]|uniref:COX15/CtaA family protein n=1 Tax=Nocardioides dongkuii TaxID=2760089 RepID=UPI001D0C06CE|nr:COX15/CtaA family protein [Nocardioides dongkuii]
MTTAPPETSTRRAPYLWPLAVANLVANILIVVTGGAVRLTSSGLGCPTWPRCTEESFVTHPELGAHGVIEFGNRMLTWILVVIAIACVVAAARSGRRRARNLAVAVALGIPAQAVLGGITVLTDLNPYVVALHFLVSMAIIGICVLLLDELRGPERPEAPALLRRLALAAFAVGWLVLWLGTIVTGSGPHSGDLDSRRTGLDPQVVSHVHAWAVYVLVALTLAMLVLARRAHADVAARAVALLLAIEVLQGVLGFVQYFNDLPELLVAVHMLGAALTSAALSWALLATRRAARTP